MPNKSKKTRSSDTGSCHHCRKKDKIIARLTNGRGKKQIFFDDKWLAKRWGISIKKVQELRYKKKGPKVTRFGRAVRYRLRDIIAYELTLGEQ